MKIVSMRAPDTVYRTWLEADETGSPWAFAIPAASPVLEASGEQWSSPYSVIALFWPETFYQVMMLLKDGQTDYYCNIITPVTHDGIKGEIRFIDLDLDVWVTDAEIRVLDEDEFVSRQSEYRPEWIRRAKAAVHTLTDMADRRVGPFSPATSAQWRAYIRQQDWNKTPGIGKSAR